MTRKPCIRCDEVKPLSEFYRHPQMGDGHLNKCKECCKAYARTSSRARAGDDEWVAKERARGRERYHRLYAPEHPLRFVSPVAPDAVKKEARNAVSNAVRDGRLVKPERCEDCGKQPEGTGANGLQGHHEDYFKPLDVVWLCSWCHHHRHREAA